MCVNNGKIVHGFFVVQLDRHFVEPYSFGEIHLHFFTKMVDTCELKDRSWVSKFWCPT